MRNILFAMLCISVVGQSQKMQTLTYFQNDTLKLELTLFTPDKKPAGNLPLMLYVHGGGFSGGERKSGDVFCKYLAQNGFAAATISYTLYMKGKKFSCDGITSEKVKAINYGVNDLWLATSFFLKNSEAFGIDTDKIFISGSSAGGEVALHAAYWDKELMKIYNSDVTENFKYAGLVSGAGAIMDLNLITEKNLLPMFLFHGNGDLTVPYATAAHHYCKTNATGWLMLFGSYAVYNHAISKNGSAALYTYCGGGHEYSGTLFEKNQQHILSFLNTVMKGHKIQSHTIISTGQKNELSAAYNFCE